MDTFHGREIVTSYVYPPIPIRSHDWCAYLDGDEGEPDAAHGWGATRDEAVAQLLVLVADDDRYARLEAAKRDARDTLTCQGCNRLIFVHNDLCDSCVGDTAPADDRYRYCP